MRFYIPCNYSQIAWTVLILEIKLRTVSKSELSELFEKHIHFDSTC